MRLTHIVNAYARQPWAIEPTILAALVNIFARKLQGEQFDGARLHAELGTAATRDRGDRQVVPRIGVVPIQGVISLRASSLGTSVDEIGADLDAMLGSRDVDAILLAVDSPGGTVTGVPELAERITEAAKQKPMLAFTDGMMASAAYWLGAAAGEVLASPSAEVGSIGVFMVHEDWSKNLEEEGISITAISAGRYKLEGAPWAPLTAEAKDFLQQSVDEAYGWFTKAVAEARKDTPGNVRNGYGEGRVLGAKDAKAANLIDRVGTFDDAVSRLVARAERKGGKRASLLREREDLEASARRVQ